MAWKSRMQSWDWHWFICIPLTLRWSWEKAERDLSSDSQKCQSRAVILRGNSSFSLQEIINLSEICQINFLHVLDWFFQLTGQEPPHKGNWILMVKFTSVLSLAKEGGKFNSTKEKFEDLFLFFSLSFVEVYFTARPIILNLGEIRMRLNARMKKKKGKNPK